MKRSPTVSSVAIAIAAAATLLVVCWRPAAVELAYPVENACSILSRKVWTRIVGAWRGSSACAENASLRREAAALAILRTDLERLEAENARLRKALAYRESAPGTWQAAAVLSVGGGAAGARNAIRVDKGSLAGVAEGAVVAVPEGLVGRVTAVTPHTSEVTLVTDARLHVACELETGGSPSPRGILSGGTTERLTLRYLTGEEPGEPRVRVLTSGLGGVFPRGLTVGAYLGRGEVMPAVEFAALEDVFIRREK